MVVKKGELLNIRITKELEDDILRTVDRFKKVMGVEINKSTIIGSAIKEGLKLLNDKLDRSK